MALPKDIENYLIDYFSGSLNKEEQHQLEEWLKSSPENRELFDALSNSDKAKDLYDLYELRQPSHWFRMRKKIRQSNREIFIGRLSRIAAAIVLPLTIAIGVYYFTSLSRDQIAANEIIQPGERKAILEFSDGDKIDLGKNSPQTLEKDGVILQIGKNLIYQKKASKSIKTFYDVINVPVGGEYSLELSDGTRVWLNASSKLRFPAIFPNGSREVWLEGEAYFEVEHNPESPFIVRTKYMDAIVLGTSFNMSAYADDAEVHITLVSGRVLVKSEGQDPKILEPNNRISLNYLTKAVEVAKVETEAYTAWKDGVFFFNNECLETIMQKASRWYNVKVVFESEDTKNMIFFGKLKRYETINKLMDIVKLTNKIDYSISENVVYIRKI